MTVNPSFHHFFSVMLIWLCLSHTVFAANSIQVTRIRLSETEQTVRAVVQLTGEPYYKVFSLHNPERLVVDLQQTQLRTNLQESTLPPHFITALRSGKIDDSGLRLVFDLKKPIRENHFLLTTNSSLKRLVIDLQEDNVSLTKTADDIVHTTPVEKITLPSQKNQRDIIVVIDPGHGGKDPGAIGLRGTREKDVVLAISRQLQAIINRTPGMHAVLTRKSDYYIGLRERLRIARRYKADMFVAVHADAFNNPYSTGSSVFALSLRGASSEAARWLAEKENYSELGGINLEDKGDMLRSVLIDLSQTATISASLQAGSSVLRELSQFTHLHHAQVEQARFVVLKSPDIPSLLVETGFLSNPKEEQRLRDEDYQARLAQAIQTGIKAYFRKNPPRDTLFAAKKQWDES